MARMTKVSGSENKADDFVGQVVLDGTNEVFLPAAMMAPAPCPDDSCVYKTFLHLICDDGCIRGCLEGEQVWWSLRGCAVEN